MQNPIKFRIFDIMSGVGITRILREQLEAANATNAQLLEEIRSLRKTVDTQAATIKSMEVTISSLQETLLQKKESLESAEAQKRALGKLIEKENEKIKTPVINLTDEQKAALIEQKAESRKKRGNNGAKRNMHYELVETVEDVYPSFPGFDKDIFKSIGVKEIIRYRMLPIRFEKVIYRNHCYKIDGQIVSGNIPETPIFKSSYEASFIAGIAELRYLESLPVERIVKYFQDHGFDLDKNTAHALLARVAEILEPLYRCLAESVKGSDYVICDETYHTVLVAAESNSGKGSKKGYLWDMIAPTLNLMYFFYDEGSRKSDIILEELKEFAGVLQSDGLKAYKRVAELAGGKVLKLSCLQHCKRGFIDFQGNPDDDEVLSLANQLYHHEKQHEIGVEGWTEDDNLKWRRQYAPEILLKLKTALIRISNDLTKYPPKSEIHKAGQYFLNEFDGIEAIFTTGKCSLDTNDLERMNRYVSMSRRNSLFFGSHAGAQRAAIFYSLACSCRMCEVNFFDYFTDVISKVSQMNPFAPSEQFRELLPDRWSKAL